MEGCFLNKKYGPNPNVLQTGTAAWGQCQFAVAEPRHIFLHIFLRRLCWLSCIHSVHSKHLLYKYQPLLQQTLGDWLSFTWMWFWECELGQQHEHNLCLSPGLWGQQLFLLGWFAYGLGRILSESTVLDGWGQKICLLWTNSHRCNIKPAFGVQEKDLLKK